MVWNICLRTFNWNYKKRHFTMDFIYGFHLSSSNLSKAVTIWKIVHGYKNWLVSTWKELSLKENFKLTIFVLKQLVTKAMWVFKYSSSLEFWGVARQIINCVRSKQTLRKTPPKWLVFGWLYSEILN